MRWIQPEESMLAFNFYMPRVILRYRFGQPEPPRDLPRHRRVPCVVEAGDLVKGAHAHEARVCPLADLNLHGARASPFR